MFGSSFEATRTSVLQRYDALICELHNLALTSATGEEVLGVMQELETRHRHRHRHRSLAVADHAL
ncbi:MAG TPA: hypothetical protein VIM17_11585, partial [Jatrophihabitantaceae bacterium]